MAHPLGCPRILEAPGQPIGKAEFALDLREHQDTGVRGHPSTVEGDMHRLAGDG